MVVQRKVIQTLKEVQKQIGAALIMIGHDMGLMAQSVDRLAVMYAGKHGRERADPALLPQPAPSLQPASAISSLPTPDEVATDERNTRRHSHRCSTSQPGAPFILAARQLQPHCSVEVPASRRITEDRDVACHLRDRGDGRCSTLRCSISSRSSVALPEPRVEGEPFLALDGFNLRIEADRPKIVAIAGESGSGKTTLARVVLGMLPPPAARCPSAGKSITVHEPA